MKRNSSLLALEIIWIITGIICIGTGLSLTIKGSAHKPIVFTLMSFVCFAFAWLRHMQRKKLQQEENKKG